MINYQNLTKRISINFEVEGMVLYTIQRMYLYISHIGPTDTVAYYRGMVIGPKHVLQAKVQLYIKAREKWQYSLSTYCFMQHDLQIFYKIVKRLIFNVFLLNSALFLPLLSVQYTSQGNTNCILSCVQYRGTFHVVFFYRGCMLCMTLAACNAMSYSSSRILSHDLAFIQGASMLNTILPLIISKLAQFVCPLCIQNGLFGEFTGAKP